MPASQDDSKRNRRTAKRILAIGLPLVVIAGTGIGYAFWTAGGTGSGSASSAASPAGVVLSGSASGFAPGKPVTVPIYATNSNGYDVSVTGLTASATTASELNCGGGASNDLSVGTPTLLGGATSVSVPTGGASTQVGSVVVSMTNATYNQNACKGASLSLTFGAS